jgi:hypothetical protein
VGAGAVAALALARLTATDQPIGSGNDERSIAQWVQRLNTHTQPIQIQIAKSIREAFGCARHISLAPVRARGCRRR